MENKDILAVMKPINISLKKQFLEWEFDADLFFSTRIDGFTELFHFIANGMPDEAISQELFEEAVKSDMETALEYAMHSKHWSDGLFYWCCMNDIETVARFVPDDCLFWTPDLLEMKREA